MNKLWVVQENSLDPLHNLAMEYQLLQTVKPDELILYLWQNQNTVVIGRNQNAYKECNISLLKQEKGHLVRRMSGGGAVFHDLGNLNFTFLMHKNNEDIQKQTQIIVEALKLVNIEANINGRNDLLVNQRKCSGHAYFTQKDHCYHHGTLLLKVDQEKMERFLKPHVAKLKAKGVDSVRSRVINLVEINPQLTIANLKQALIQATANQYQLEPISYSTELDLAQALKLFSSEKWIYGEHQSFAITKHKYCSFGMLEIECEVIDQVIHDVQVYSDSMDLALIDKIKVALRGIDYQLSTLKQALSGELSEVYSLWSEENL